MKLEYVRHGTERMFENDFLEATSKVHPATPFVIYVPFVVGLLAYGLARHLTTPLWTVPMMALGWATWCFMEYGIHRGFFHWEGNGPVGRKIHDIVHGYHHRYPDDPLRAVMPLGASLPLAFVLGGILLALGFPKATLPYFCGIVSGYLFYDFMHYAIHHRTPRTSWGKAVRAHHMAHHFACPTLNFGISHRWVDRIFGTLRRRSTERSGA
jgi:dihydroceramide fatty acyl 2-hydroxylase